jgi:hypothetical protein
MGGNDYGHEGFEIQLSINEVRGVDPQIEAAGASRSPRMSVPIANPLQSFTLVRETSKTTAVVQIPQKVRRATNRMRTRSSGEQNLY